MKLATDCRTLIDVGCAYGTPKFYALHEQAYLLLIDALTEYEPYMKSILSERSGDYVIAALDAFGKTLPFNVCVDDPKKSTAHARSIAKHKFSPRVIQTRTLDSIVAEYAPPIPYGLKIVVEGHEPEVLSGATETLKQTYFVIMETSVRRRFLNGYTFRDLVNQMDAAGFDVADIIDAPGNDRGYYGYLDLLYINRHFQNDPNGENA